MCRFDENGDRATGVVCPCCSALFEIRQEEGAHGREKALLRDALAGALARIDGMQEAHRDYAARMDLARTRDAERAAEIVARCIDGGARMSHALSEAVREMDGMRWRIESRSNYHNPADLEEIARLKAEMAEKDARLGFYETPNSRRAMPSLYDAKVKKRAREMAESCTRPRPEAPRGPPMGHPGRSHRMKPGGSTRCRLGTCPDCGKKPSRLLPVKKLFFWKGPDGRTRCTLLVIEKGWCGRCGKKVRADAPDVKGTCLSPELLAQVLVLYALQATDRRLSQNMAALIGFKVSPSTLRGARKAIAGVLGPFMRHLEKLILSHGYAHFDETVLRMFGRQGYVWLVAVPFAAMFVARPSRSAAIFEEEFAFCRGMPGVADGYFAYRMILGAMQRCWRHLMNNFKNAALTTDGSDVRAAYGDFCALYERIKDKDTAPKAERDAIVEQALAIAARLPEGRPSRTEIEAAGECLVTFLMYRGMSPTNNPGESDIRCGVVPHRSIRHQLRTGEGARVFSIIVSFIITCVKQGVPMGETFVRLAQGEDPADIFKPGQVAEGRWGGPTAGPPRPDHGPLAGLACAAEEGGGGGEAGAASADTRGSPAPDAPVPPAPEAADPPPAPEAADPPPAPDAAAPEAADPPPLKARTRRLPPAPPKARARASAVPHACNRPPGLRTRRLPPPAAPMLRQPPKPPPCTRACRTRRRRPGNWHIPIKPTVPPPRPPDGPEIRAHRQVHTA